MNFFQSQTESFETKMTMVLLLRVMVGMILLGGLSRAAAAAVEEVDYEATNYYNGEYDANDGVVSSTYTDDDVNDDSYVITGAPSTGDSSRKQAILTCSFGHKMCSSKTPYIT